MAYENLGNCYRLEVQYGKAKENYEIALSIAKRTGNKSGEGHIYGNLGVLYYRFKQYAKAIEQHEKQLSIAKQMEDKASEGNALGKLAESNYALGQYAKSIEQNEMRLAIAKQTGDKAEEEKAHNNLGNCYEFLGQHVKAIKHYELGLNIAEKVGSVARKLCSHTHIGRYYRTLGQYDKAIEHHEIALKIAIRTGNHRVRGDVHDDLGTCYLSSEEYVKATKHCWTALRIAREIGDEGMECDAHDTVGVSFFCLGEHRKAMVHFLVHLNLAKQTGEKRSEMKAYLNLAECFMALGHFENAEINFRSCLQCIEHLLDKVPEDHFRVSIFDSFINVYRRLILALVLQGKDEDALVIAERGRARALANLMMANRPAECSDFTTPKALDLRCISEVVKGLGTTVLFFTFLCHEVCTWVIQPPGDVILRRICIHEISTQAQHTHSQGFTPHVDNLVSLIERAMAVLRRGCIGNCEDRSLSFLYPEVSPSKTKSAWPGPVTQQVTTTRSSPAVLQTDFICPNSGNIGKSGESGFSDPLEELYQIVLGPVREFVEGSQVVVIPDGPLSLVPFAALVDANGHYVVESLQVRLVPSLATARMIYEQPHEPKGRGRPLIVGDPDVGQIKNGDKITTVKRLPHANAEAQAIAELFSVQPLTGNRATKDTFLQKLESANLIHIAAHGDMERGEILLAPSPDGGRIPNIEDAMLTISDLEHKRLNAKLVVLSSCHSARGKIRAEGVIGIARAFLGAGARTVLVTLWGIEDEATLYFMRKFYEQLIRGERANESLCTARKTLKESEDFSHPYYWAPFVLIGDDVSLF